MKVILHPREGADRADLIELACVASFALTEGIADKPVGEVMCVTRGADYANTFGVIRRKGSITVYAPKRGSNV